MKILSSAILLLLADNVQTINIGHKQSAKFPQDLSNLDDEAPVEKLSIAQTSLKSDTSSSINKTVNSS